jgi:hypothetical protein
MGILFPISPFYRPKIDVLFPANFFTYNFSASLQ